jgi:hypothetical protein
MEKTGMGYAKRNIKNIGKALSESVWFRKFLILSANFLKVYSTKKLRSFLFDFKAFEKVIIVLSRNSLKL